jgi:hypothetical protein
MQDMYETFLGFPLEKGQSHETPEDQYMPDMCKAQELLSVVHAGRFNVMSCSEFC